MASPLPSSFRGVRCRGLGTARTVRLAARWPAERRPAGRLGAGVTGLLRWAFTQADWGVIRLNSTPLRRGPLSGGGAMAALAGHALLATAAGLAGVCCGPTPAPTAAVRLAGERSHRRHAAGAFALWARPGPCSCRDGDLPLVGPGGPAAAAPLGRRTLGAPAPAGGAAASAAAAAGALLVGLGLISGGVGCAGGPHRMGRPAAHPGGGQLRDPALFPPGGAAGPRPAQRSAAAADRIGDLHRVLPRGAADHAALPRAEHPRFPAAGGRQPRSGLAGRLGAHLFAAAYLAEAVRSGLAAVPTARSRPPVRSASPTPRPCCGWCCPRRCGWPCRRWWASSSPSCRTPRCSP